MLPFSLRSRTASLHTIAIFTVFLGHARPVHGAPDSIGQWLNNALPQPGSTLKDEMLCYALPFGAIGFASHLLTYYTLHMLLAARSPWSFKEQTLEDGHAPWSRQLALDYNHQYLHDRPMQRELAVCGPCGLENDFVIEPGLRERPHGAQPAQGSVREAPLGAWK